MPPPQHTHRNHPPITPHPKTVFLSDLSVCITDSAEGTPVALHNRFDELSTISEIPEIPNSPPPPPSNASPPHTPSQTSTSSYTYTYATEPRSPTSLLHSPEHTTVTPHVHDHSYASLPTTQTDAITKVNNWMKDGSVCSDSSSSSEAVTAASAPTPATYAAAAAASPTQPPALAIASPIHSPTHSNTYTPPVSSCQAQTILIDNITTKHTRAEIEIKLRRQFPGVRYALTFLKRGGLALVLETPKEINTILKQTKWDEDFFGKDLYIHLANKDARPWLCVNKVPPTMELAKIKEGISSIDPVVGMGNWEIKIEGLHRKFKGSYPTQLVLFKVQNDLVAKNITDQNFTIDGKQFKIREYLESTSFRCTRCQELGSHLSKDCSNPKKCVRCAGPDCEIRNCKKGTLLCSNCGGGHSAAHKSCPALKAKNQNLFHQKQQKSHADVLISRQKHQLDEIISLREQVSEIAHLKSDFLALKTELAEVKEQNKRYEKKLSELITYSIFHTKNTKAQEEICFIVRREAEKVFSYPSEQATDPGSSTLSTSATHTPTPSLPTTQTQVTSSPHIHQSPLHRSPMITPPPLSPPRHTLSTSQQPVRSSLRIRNQHRPQSQS